MDPNELLRRLRAVCGELNAVDFDDERIHELARGFEDFDTWIRSGGSLPREWQR